MFDPKKLFIILLNFIFLLIVGTVGYTFLLNVSLIESLYMTMITVSTVGFGEIAPLSTAAKIFTIVIIFWGLGIVGYTFSTFVVALVDGKIKELWRHKILDNRISKLKDHYIICGAGDTAEVIIEEFVKNDLDFVVIEEDVDKYFNLTEREILCINGNSADDSILERANIDKATGLISALENDIDNIMAVLSARQLNRRMYIISNARDDHAPQKLKKAGADKVISTNQISGRRMAALMLRPNVITFLDLINNVGEIELEVQDVIVNKDSYLEGISLKEAQIPKKTGLTVLAVKAINSENINFNINPDRVFLKGDTLLILGTEDQVSKLRELAGDNGLRKPTLN